MATSAAYDLRKGDGSPVPPMLWHYQVVSMSALPRVKHKWPDGVEGHEYTPVVLELANERLDLPYADENEFTAPLEAPLRGALGDVPLLVRLQYMNECHALNGAAAMALVRHAQRHGLRWTIGGVAVAEIGWRWGSCADGVSMSILNFDPASGQQRVKHQAHAHQVCTLTTVDGAEHVLDLSAAQFGLTACVQSVPELIEATAGCTLSSTLARRAAAGLAPALLAPLGSDAGLQVMPKSRVSRGQSAVEEALALVDARGYPRRAGFLLCGHLMPGPLFGRRDPAKPGPDDDLVEGGALLAFRKFDRALQRAMRPGARGTCRT
jgi:hypothetical protein